VALLAARGSFSSPAPAAETSTTSPPVRPAEDDLAAKRLSATSAPRARSATGQLHRQGFASGLIPAMPQAQKPCPFKPQPILAAGFARQLLQAEGRISRLGSHVYPEGRGQSHGRGIAIATGCLGFWHRPMFVTSYLLVSRGHLRHSPVPPCHIRRLASSRLVGLSYECSAAGDKPAATPCGFEADQASTFRGLADASIRPMRPGQRSKHLRRAEPGQPSSLSRSIQRPLPMNVSGFSGGLIAGWLAGFLCAAWLRPDRYL